MSALGQKKADMCSATRYVRFVPIADIKGRAKRAAIMICDAGVRARTPADLR
jgi:hypothetical protein